MPKQKPNEYDICRYQLILGIPENTPRSADPTEIEVLQYFEYYSQYQEICSEHKKVARKRHLL